MSAADVETLVERTPADDVPLAILGARPEDLANEPVDAGAETRCESCGAPVDAAGLCPTCERIFRKVLQPKPAPPAAAVAPPPIPPPIPTVTPAPMAPPLPGPPLAHAAEPKPQPRRVPPAPKPVPPPPKSSWHLGWLGAIAVVGAVAILVVAVAVPLSQQWLERQWGGPVLTKDRAAAPEAEARAPAAGSTATTAAPHGTTASPAPVRAEAPRPKVANDKPSPRKTATRASGNRAAQSKTATTEASAAPAPPPPSAPLVAEVVAPPEPVAPAAAPEPAVVPVGQIFERAQVNEPPRVESQVEPNVPTALQGQALDDVVILRVLVSHTGRPATVNVLRKSKTGANLDEAVVAAVKRWTFAPALRRGQAVNCWFNVGVPVRRAG